MWAFAASVRTDRPPNRTGASICALLVLGACSKTENDPLEPTDLRVAAIHYLGTPRAVDSSCTTSACAVEALVRRARAEGASLVVTPEYAFDQVGSEPDPDVGATVSDDRVAPLQTHFGKLADELDIHLVIDLQTTDGEQQFNTQVAFGPNGGVVGKHHKFELFQGEKNALTAGSSVTTFDTPVGDVGLLICADLYGDTDLHQKLAQGARVVAVSSFWTAAGATRWQAAFARDWGVYVVASNASDGEGVGSGIFDPLGNALAVDRTLDPTSLVVSIPPRP